LSLKVFHIVFITVSTVLSFGLAAYAWVEVEGGLRLLWVALSLGLGIVLILYGRAFMKKMKDIRTE
jgi:hypothetical protein